MLRNKPYPVTRAFRALLFSLLPLVSVMFSPVSGYTESQFQPGIGFVEDVVIPTLPAATAVAFAPDNRVFIALKNGIVRVFHNGALLSTPFIDISAQVNTSTDRGLLGIAVHPQFPIQPYVYLFFTYDPPELVPDARSPRVGRLVRVTANQANQYNSAVPDSGLILLGTNSTAANTPDAAPPEDKSIPEKASCMTGGTMDGVPVENCIPSDAPAHTVGALVFASDGSLFASTGDAASYDTATKLALRAQNLDSLAGKILRINPDTGEGVPGNPYFQPENPGSNRSRVWAMGMRNPFRIALDPLLDQPIVGEVGSSSWEEINFGKGANFGWPCYEGGIVGGTVIGPGVEGGNTTNLRSSFGSFSRTKDFCDAQYALGQSAVTRAVYSYQHPLDTAGRDLGAAVTGVAYYTGQNYPPKYISALFYADFVAQAVRYITFDVNGYPTSHNFATEIGTGLRPVQLIAGPDTNIHALYLDLHNNKSQLRRFRYAGAPNALPLVFINATPFQGLAPLSVAFRSDGTLDPDGQGLTLSWNFGDGTGSTQTHPSHFYNVPGTYTAELTATETTAPFASSTEEKIIRVGIDPPRTTITQPTPGSTYRIGDLVSFSGSAVYQGQPIASNMLRWTVLQHHNSHEHLLTEVIGTSGQVTLSEHSDLTFYDICLEATAPDALNDIQCVALLPETVPHTFASNPPGALITYIDEGKSVIAPYVAQPIVNSEQTIVAAPVANSRSFTGWSDGVTNGQRTFTVGTSPVTFTAEYQNFPPTAAIAASKLSGAAPLNVVFDGTGSAEPEGDLLSYMWMIAGRSVAGAVVQKTFTTAGVYPITLTVTDKLGAFHTASVEINVFPPIINTAPVVSSGLTQTLPFGAPVFLTGTASDDGYPFVGQLTVRWTKVAGPGTVAFQNSKSADTQVTLSKAGTYALKLEGYDSALRSNQVTLVTVNPNAAQSVSSFALIDANTDNPIPGYEQIANGAIIQLSSLPTQAVNIRANTVPPQVGSVKFLFDGKTTFSTDNSAPYALKADSSGNFPAWPAAVKRHLLTAIPYTKAKATGAAGKGLSIEMTFK